MADYRVISAHAEDASELPARADQRKRISDPYFGQDMNGLFQCREIPSKSSGEANGELESQVRSKSQITHTSDDGALNSREQIATVQVQNGGLPGAIASGSDCAKAATYFGGSAQRAYIVTNH